MTRVWIALLVLGAVIHGSLRADLSDFGVVTIDPALDLNGAGSNVDSIAFWEAPTPRETLMFVTGKGNDVVEVWKFPFENNEQAEISFPANVNGVVVDQETDPDLGGRINLEEFALDGDPLTGLDPLKERVAVEEFGGSRYLSWTLPIRRGATFQNGSASIDGVVYSLQGSKGLLSFGAQVAEAQSVRAEGLPALGSDYQYRSFRLTDPVTTSTEGFLRRTVEAVP